MVLMDTSFVNKTGIRNFFILNNVLNLVIAVDDGDLLEVKLVLG